MDNKRGQERMNVGGNYGGKYTVCKDQCDDEETNVHSGFTRHMTAAAATLNKTTPSAVEYRAAYYDPNSVPNVNVGQYSTHNVFWNPIGICYTRVQTRGLLFGANK